MAVTLSNATVQPIVGNSVTVTSITGGPFDVIDAYVQGGLWNGQPLLFKLFATVGTVVSLVAQATYSGPGPGRLSWTYVGGPPTPSAPAHAAATTYTLVVVAQASFGAAIAPQPITATLAGDNGSDVVADTTSSATVTATVFETAVTTAGGYVLLADVSSVLTGTPPLVFSLYADCGAGSVRALVAQATTGGNNLVEALMVAQPLPVATNYTLTVKLASPPAPGTAPVSVTASLATSSPSWAGGGGGGGAGHGTAGQFLVTNNTGTAAVWTTITGDIAASVATVGQLNVQSITPTTGAATIVPFNAGGLKLATFPWVLNDTGGVTRASLDATGRFVAGGGTGTNFYVEIGPGPTPTSMGAVWILPNGTASTVLNPAVFSDSAGNTSVNAWSGAGAISLLSVGSTFMARFTTTDMFLGGSSSTAPLFIDWTTATAPFIQGGSSSTSLAVGTNNGAGVLNLQAGAAHTIIAVSGTTVTVTDTGTVTRDSIELAHGKFTAGGGGTDAMIIIGPYTSVATEPAIYLLPNGASPTAANFGILSDGTNLYFNTIGAGGSIFISENNATDFVSFQSTASTFGAWSLTASPIILNYGTATAPFIQSGTGVTTSLTIGTNNNTAALFLQSGAAANAVKYQNGSPQQTWFDGSGAVTVSWTLGSAAATSMTIASGVTSFTLGWAAAAGAAATTTIKGQAAGGTNDGGALQLAGGTAAGASRADGSVKIQTPLNTGFLSFAPAAGTNTLTTAQSDANMLLLTGAPGVGFTIIFQREIADTGNQVWIRNTTGQLATIQFLSGGAVTVATATSALVYSNGASLAIQQNGT